MGGRNGGVKGRDGLGDTLEVEPGWGGRDAVLGTRGPVCDLVSRERCLPLHIHTHTLTHTVFSFLCFSGVCHTCLAAARPVSSLVQQIFT